MRLTPDQRAIVAKRIAELPAAIVLDTTAHPATASVPVRYVVVRPGEGGYTPLRGQDGQTLDEVEAVITVLFKTRAATPAEREAALAGSMFGWHTPAADPALYAGKVS